MGWGEAVGEAHHHVCLEIFHLHPGLPPGLYVLCQQRAALSSFMPPGALLAACFGRAESGETRAQP